LLQLKVLCSGNFLLDFIPIKKPSIIDGRLSYLELYIS